jgi:UPF0716 family protein affecting phage T7 exclusion
VVAGAFLLTAGGLSALMGIATVVPVTTLTQSRISMVMSSVQVKAQSVGKAGAVPLGAGADETGVEAGGVEAGG